MKVRLPVLVKDPEVSNWKDVEPIEQFTLDSEDFFLDGPVTRRIAVLDFDPATGELTHGVRFIPPSSEKDFGTYDVPASQDLHDPTLIKVTTFGGVFKTLRMFEEADTLGRRVSWAFHGPQLLVIPRAGEWANAFYERDSRSIQLFFFTPPGARRPIYTSHSQDIIAHETAHAAIDCVAPDLYHSTSPEGLAIHESIADLATLIMAFRSRELASRILQQTNGSIEHSSAFTAVAEQFGGALRRNRPLRDLKNDRKMTDRDLDKGEPHALSEILSGALYSIMVRIYDELRGAPEEEEAPTTRIAVSSEYRQWAESTDPSTQQFRAGERHRASSGRALFIASERFKRTVLRALDYLPPGEVSFADFGRALLASDQASHPDSGEQRDWLKKEFVRRGIVARAKELDVKTNFKVEAVNKLDLEELVRSDWLAYQFADQNRKLLGIPPDEPFEVKPRLDVTKKYYHRETEPVFVRECLFKVSWSIVEPNKVGGGLPSRRRIIQGTTLAVDWKTKQVRAIVRGATDKSLQRSRDVFLKRLVARDAIRFGDESKGPSGKSLRGVVSGEVTKGVLRMRATARALHVIEEH